MRLKEGMKHLITKDKDIYTVENYGKHGRIIAKIKKVSADKFIVLKDSKIADFYSSSVNSVINNKRVKEINDGHIDRKEMIILEDMEFTSPKYALMFILGTQPPESDIRILME